MRAHAFAKSASRLILTACLIAGSVSVAHAGDKKTAEPETPAPITPTEQYSLRAETRVEAINLRVEAHGLSDNQRRALDQVAGKAAWTNGHAIDVQIITANDPAAIAAGNSIGAYLAGHDVADEDMTQYSQDNQPADVVTVNLVKYRAHVDQCNTSWENLAKTGKNETYKNFGCALTANIAAQVADPRDLAHPADATPADPGRKATIMDKYRKGDVTSATQDEQAKGTISDAIK